METNLDVGQYIDAYRNLMSSLTTEKQENNNKEEKIKKLLSESNLFTIEGDETFKENIQKCFEDLVKNKPGRMLIKEFLIVNKEVFDLSKKVCKFKIKQGSCRHNLDEIFFTFDNTFDNIDLYNAIKWTAVRGTENIVAEKPRMVSLAHELIHGLHNRHDMKRQLEFYKACKDSKTVDYSEFQVDYSREIHISRMDSNEEQHTISGINIPLFLKKNKLDKCDILCENAFLMALQLPPRVDHRSAEDYPLNTNNTTDYGFYYDWMKRALEKREIDITNYCEKYGLK